MRFLVSELGGEPPGFDRALRMLRRFQTIWTFADGPMVPKPDSRELHTNFDVLQLDHNFNFIIGVTSGHIDHNHELNFISSEDRKAIISDDEFQSLGGPAPIEVFWALSLANIAFRASLNKTCEIPNCICSKISIENILLSLLEMDLCEQCIREIKERYRYQIPEIRELISIIKRYNKYDDFPLFKMPSLPILSRQLRRQAEIRNRNIFTSYGIIIVMHFLEDLVPFLEGLIYLGARPEAISLIVKPYPYSQRIGVHGYLSEHYPGLAIEYLSELPPPDSVLDHLTEKSRTHSPEGKLIIIEDGGYVVPYFHRKYSSESNFCVGAVEQTTKGIKSDEKVKEQIKGLLFPIINVAKSKFKDEYEAPLVGRAIVNNIQRLLPEVNLSGETALVVGFGAIGRQVAYALQKLGLIVRVSDNKLEQRIAARVQGFEAGETVDKIKGCRIIVGTTGEQSISREELANLANGAILVSCSSDQIEIDLKHLQIMAKDIDFKERYGTEYFVEKGLAVDKYVLLADGFPINFFYGSGIPNKAIDPILAQLLIGAVELATNRELKNDIQKEDEMNRIIIQNKLMEDFIDVYP